MSLRSAVVTRLATECGPVVRVSNSPAIVRINGHRVGIRTATEKSGDKYWFDATPSLYETPEVDFLLYACGSAERLYIFPVEDFRQLVQGASLGGQKQVPNFTLYLNNHEFEPAGMSRRRRKAAAYYNRLELLAPQTR